MNTFYCIVMMFLFSLFTISCGNQSETECIKVELNVSEARSFSEGLAAVYVNSKWGYIDRSGKLVIEPKFNSGTEFIGGFSHHAQSGDIDEMGEIVDYHITRFYTGLASIERNLKWGFINEEKEIVIEPQFDWTSGFRDWNRALVRKDDKYGYIDRNGKVVIPILYDFGSASFNAGLAAVGINGRFGFINDTGKIKIDLKYDRVLSFVRFQPPRFELNTLVWRRGKMWERSLAAVRETDKWGFINRKGEMEISPIYDSVECLSNKAYVVMQNGKWCFLDLKTNDLKQDIFDVVLYSENDNFIVIGKYGKFGLVDFYGSTIIDPIFDYFPVFREGCAWIQLNSNIFSLIDISGNILIARNVYDEVHSFSGGLARIGYYDKYHNKTMYGYIDKRGECVIRPKFYEAGDFQEGLAPVKLGRKWGYIDDTGKMVIEFQ